MASFVYEIKIVLLKKNTVVIFSVTYFFEKRLENLPFDI